jgi:hypothetical protein
MPPTYRIHFVPRVTDKEVAALARRFGTNDCKRRKLQNQELRTDFKQHSIYIIDIYSTSDALVLVFFTVYVKDLLLKYRFGTR